MKKIFIIIFLSVVSVNVYAQINPSANPGPLDYFSQMNYALMSAVNGLAVGAGASPKAAKSTALVVCCLVPSVLTLGFVIAIQKIFSPPKIGAPVLPKVFYCTESGECHHQ